VVQKSADSIASSRAARLAGNRQREGWRRQKFPHRHAPSSCPFRGFRKTRSGRTRAKREAPPTDAASVSIRSPSSSSGCSDGICVIPLHSIAMFTAIAEEITENGILHVCLLRGRDTGLPVLGEEFLLGAFEIVHMPVLSCPCAPPHATRAVTFPTAYTSLPHPTSYSLLLRQ